MPKEKKENSRTSVHFLKSVKIMEQYLFLTVLGNKLANSS